MSQQTTVVCVPDIPAFQNIYSLALPLYNYLSKANTSTLDSATLTALNSAINNFTSFKNTYFDSSGMYNYSAAQCSTYCNSSDKNGASFVYNGTTASCECPQGSVPNVIGDGTVAGSKIYCAPQNCATTVLVGKQSELNLTTNTCQCPVNYVSTYDKNILTYCQDANTFINNLTAVNNAIDGVTNIYTKPKLISSTSSVMSPYVSPPYPSLVGI